MSTRCDVKVFYDTEFAAIVVAARRGAEWGAQMEPYKCGTHWHITHSDPTLRSKYFSKKEQEARKAKNSP